MPRLTVVMYEGGGVENLRIYHELVSWGRGEKVGFKGSRTFSGNLEWS